MMTAHYSASDIRQKYDGAARQYTRMETVQETLGMGRLRRRLLTKASGDVLEIACGTGANFPHYPAGCRITAIDLSSGMLEIARERAAKLRLDITLRNMDAEALDYTDGSVDTVVSSLSTCTFPDPVAALREMGRVCRPDGRILLLEHGRSHRGWLARFQDRNAHRHAQHLGCHWNREPLDLVECAGLQVTSARRTFFGVLFEIEARPPSTEHANERESQ